MNPFQKAFTALKSWGASVTGWGASDALSRGGTSYPGGHPRQRPSETAAIDASTIVEACLVTILDAFVDAPIATTTVGTDGQDQYDHTTIFAELMLRPDPLRKISGRRQAKALVASYELDGNAYLDLVFDSLGYVREATYVPHWAVKPIADRDGLLAGYEITMADGTVQKRAPNEMVHFANGIDPKNPLKGQSGLRKLFGLVLTDLEADAYTAEIIANPAIVGWSVMPKEDIDPSDAELVESKIMTKFGRGGRGGVMVPHFAADISPLGFSPADLLLDKIRQVPEERVSAVMNVPAIVAGLGAGLARSTFKNTEEARKYFARYKMAPLWDGFQEEYSIQLLPQCEGYARGQRAGYDLRRIADLQPDQDALHARAREDFQANVIKRSEARSAIGLPSGPADEIYYSDAAPPAPAATPEQLKAKIAERRRAQEAVQRALEARDGGA